MSDESVSPKESGVVFDELAEAASGLDFADALFAQVAQSAPEIAPVEPLSSVEAVSTIEAAPAIEAVAAVQPFAFGKEGPRPTERLIGLERMAEKLARAIRPAVEP